MPLASAHQTPITSGTLHTVHTPPHPHVPFCRACHHAEQFLTQSLPHCGNVTLSEYVCVQLVAKQLPNNALTFCKIPNAEGEICLRASLSSSSRLSVWSVVGCGSSLPLFMLLCIYCRRLLVQQGHARYIGRRRLGRIRRLGGGRLASAGHDLPI